MTKVKICGLTREEDIACVNELLPDYIGFVFAEKSRRYVTFERAAELKKLSDKRIKAVGVFTDAPAEIVADTANKGIIDLIQLHGKEDEEYIVALRALTAAPIIKAFGIKSVLDAENAEKSSADYVLLDNVCGGSGEEFDRALIKGVKREYFLAGGLTPENVSKAIEPSVTYAVDVSSGVETDGFKDKNKIREFIDRVREIKE